MWYGCNKGYQLEGPLWQLCTAFGLSPTAVVRCRAVAWCPPLPSPVFGSVTNNTGLVGCVLLLSFCSFFSSFIYGY